VVEVNMEILLDRVNESFTIAAPEGAVMVKPEDL